MNQKLLYALLGGSLGAYAALQAGQAAPAPTAAPDADPTPAAPQPPVAAPVVAPSLLAGLDKLHDVVQLLLLPRPPASVAQLTIDAGVALVDAVQAYAPDEVNALWALRRLTAIIAQEPREFRNLLLQKYWQTLDADR